MRLHRRPVGVVVLRPRREAGHHASSTRRCSSSASQEFGETFIPMWDRIAERQEGRGDVPQRRRRHAFRAGLAAADEAQGLHARRRRRIRGRHHRLHRDDQQVQERAVRHLVNWTAPAGLQRRSGSRPRSRATSRSSPPSRRCCSSPPRSWRWASWCNNIATDIWWSPVHAVQAALDGTTAKQLGDNFSQATGKQWAQSLGTIYSLFEVALNAFTKAPTTRTTRTRSPRSCARMNYTGMCGALNFTGGPVPGVAIMKPAGVPVEEGHRKVPLRPHDRRQLGQPGRARSAATCSRRTRRSSAPMTALLQLESVSKRFGQVLVAGTCHFEVAVGATAGHRRPERRRQDEPVRHDLRRPAARRRRRQVRRPVGHRARRGRAVPARHRAHLPGAASLRRNDGVRERAGRRRIKAPGCDAPRASTARSTSSTETGLDRHANTPAGRLGLLQRKRLEVARALATQPRLLMLDEVGRRPHRSRGRRACRDRPGGQRPRHRGGVDRARRPGAAVDGRSAGLPGHRPAHRRRRAARRSEPAAGEGAVPRNGIHRDRRGRVMSADMNPG